MTETLFHKIINGEIPCHRVYENDQVLAFLDINPLSPGHTLLLPKEATETLDQLSEQAAAALGRALPRLCRAILAATGCHAYNVLQNNGAEATQEVPYVHFHIIPKYPDGHGLGLIWGAHALDADQGAALAQDIAGRL